LVFDELVDAEHLLTEQPDAQLIKEILQEDIIVST
jgi:hypothetical protein